MPCGLPVVAGWVIGALRLINLWSFRISVRDIPDMMDVHELEIAGAVSTGAGLLFGLNAPTSPDPAHDARAAAVRADSCTALFDSQTDQCLPIAFFSDFNCPNCRGLDAILLDYDAAIPGTICIIRHELPLLGAASTIASQGVLAADR